MTRVHVVGAAGYAASEVVRHVLAHPDLELGAVESRSHAGQPIGAHVPLLRRVERPFDSEGSTLARLTSGDIVVSGAKNDEARALAPRVLERGARFVDLADTFRLHAHAAQAIYGFTERYRDALRGATLVANPGCYPTAALLGLWPLAEFARDIVQIVIDAKSGVTGAGRSPSTASLFGEVAEDVRAYGFGGHRHEPEIAQELDACGIDAPFVFTPQVVPLRRGMLSCAYVTFARPADETAVAAAFAKAYAGSPFVRVLGPDRAPNLVALAGTNDAEIHLTVRGKVARVIVGIDNLGKGAAGQAMQNLNVMCGLPEERGLHDRLIAP